MPKKVAAAALIPPLFAGYLPINGGVNATEPNPFLAHGPQPKRVVWGGKYNG